MFNLWFDDRNTILPNYTNLIRNVRHTSYGVHSLCTLLLIIHLIIIVIIIITNFSVAHLVQGLDKLRVHVQLSVLYFIAFTFHALYTLPNSALYTHSVIPYILDKFVQFTKLGFIHLTLCALHTHLYTITELCFIHFVCFMQFTA